MNSEPHQVSQRDRIARARQSLEGLCCGDAFGERFFISPEVAVSLIDQRSVPAPPWIFTDDTMMAISIVATLEKCGEIDQDHLAMSFAKNYDSSRGYGPAMHNLLASIRQGNYWQKESQALFAGQGSYGNGAAMRVAPLGAYFADDLAQVVCQAERSAVTTHSHAEAVAGAIAVAVAAALAWQCAASEKLSSANFLQKIWQHTPRSAVRDGIQKAADLPVAATMRDAVWALGNGSLVTAQDTVPFALWSAARNLDNYENALWTTVSGLGDRDTTCAIVGGIVVMCSGIESIPAEWISCRESIPPHMLGSYQELRSI